ncbi:uncharacterized protein LOC118083896 [Zootoca vivipara]|uniref:uncharacterized protein LOC118083896 n=1 Tax=Zootoca vivipara TaxID=8524 RepID=UPI00293B93F5|nr:uncharacterized protein LOC118083896 [Zootoca vivipara]
MKICGKQSSVQRTAQDMSALQAEKNQDMQGMWKDVDDEETYLFDCRNFPEEPCCEPWKRAEVEARERSAPSASTETPAPDLQDSDFLPSVSLAAFLALVFVFVSMILLHHGNSHLSLGDYRAASPTKNQLPKSRLGLLRLLFPNQPETTWQILQQYIRGQLGGTNPDKPWVLVTAGLGDARSTLLCLTKATLSLLTEESAVKLRYLEQSSVWLPWRGILENGTCDISAAEIYVGQSLVPYGIMVSTWSSVDGKQLATKINLAVLLNGMKRAREEFLLQVLTPRLVSDILNTVLFADRAVDKLVTCNGSFLVLLVRSEQYLERGFVC